MLLNVEEMDTLLSVQVRDTLKVSRGLESAGQDSSVLEISLRDGLVPLESEM